MNVNLGSGQRRFGRGWINCDVVSRPPDQVPDVICAGERLPFKSCSVEHICLHHVLEHFGCGEADEMLRECARIASSGGALIITLPNLRSLAQRWLTGSIDDFIYIVNLMGAYQGEEGDRHKWHYTFESLKEELTKLGWTRVRMFDWRSIEGSDIVQDWWILGVEAVKEST